jgi:ribose transport system ATP-binding protein
METLLLNLSNISKAYPGVQALKEVNFDLRQGEVHFLLGENGAGKSTLMKILAGSVQKDSGKIQMGGKEIEINSPQESVKHKIAMVYQELSLFPNLSVGENILAGMLPINKPLCLVDWKDIKSRSKEILDELGIDVTPSTLVADLGVGTRQLIEIGKAISRQAKVLLLDEPTSALSAYEIEKLYAIIKKLLKKGIGIVYVSHKLSEIPRIAHRVTVLRDGSKIGTIEADQASEAELIRMMVGREVSEKYPKDKVMIGKPLLNVSDLSLGKRVKNVNFNIKKGEIVGIFGLMGSGRTSLARALFGLENCINKKVSIDGLEININNPRDAIKAGLGYVTEERKMGLVLRMAIAYNITFPILKRILRFGIIDHKSERRTALKFIEKLHILTPHMMRLVEHLSGGNQQKVAIARWMCNESKILIMDEPTRGIDVGAKVAVYRLLGQLANEGAGILLISSELPEIMGISDRILVMSKGELVAEFMREEADPDIIMAHAVGVNKSEAVS